MDKIYSLCNRSGSGCISDGEHDVCSRNRFLSYHENNTSPLTFQNNLSNKFNKNVHHMFLLNIVETFSCA